MMLATVHSALTGWDVVIGLLVLLVGIILERVVPPHPWVAWITCFGVFMFGCALCVKF